ncbi:MAG: hypothetical protein KF770_15460 [Anaerolineae bacterium]|nr:hypothetical protein [Anaerolineae bacterium]
MPLIRVTFAYLSYRDPIQAWLEDARIGATAVKLNGENPHQLNQFYS